MSTVVSFPTTSVRRGSADSCAVAASTSYRSCGTCCAATFGSEQPFAGLRLLHVVTVPISLNFFRGQFGFLRARGFDVEAVCSPGEEADQAREREGITIHEVPMERGIAPLADFVSLWRLVKLMRRVHPAAGYEKMAT